MLTRMAPIFAVAYWTMVHSRTVRRPDADAVAALDAQRHQTPCDDVDFGVQFGVGPAPVRWRRRPAPRRRGASRRGALEVRADRLLEQGGCRSDPRRRTTALAMRGTQACLEHLSAGVARQRRRRSRRGADACRGRGARGSATRSRSSVGGSAGSRGTTTASGVSPHFGSGTPIDRHLGDLGVRGQDVLHLGAVDVLAAGDDHVLLAVDDVDVAVLVLPHQVTGMEPAAAERLGGLLGLVPVPLHHQRAAVDDLADLAARDVVHRRRRRRGPRR